MIHFNIRNFLNILKHFNLLSFDYLRDVIGSVYTCTVSTRSILHSDSLIFIIIVVSANPPFTQLIISEFHPKDPLTYHENIY